MVSPSKDWFFIGHHTHHKEFLNDFCWFTFDTFCDFRQQSYPSVILKFCWQFVELTLCKRGFGVWLRLFCLLPFYFSCCYSSYYFFDFSLDSDYFDSFVVFWDHLLRDHNRHVLCLVELVFYDVYPLALLSLQELLLRPAAFVQLISSFFKDFFRLLAFIKQSQGFFGSLRLFEALPRLSGVYSAFCSVLGLLHGL